MIILLSSLLSIIIDSSYVERDDLTSFMKIDTVCNYIIYSNNFDHNLVLPDNFDLKEYQKGFMVLEFVVNDLDSIVGWKINLFRIMENDSIIRHYSRYTDEKVPPDIESLYSRFDDFINTIRIKAINKEDIDPSCRISVRLELVKK